METSKHYAFIPKRTLVADEYKALCQHAKVLYNYLAAERAGKDAWFSYSYKSIRRDSGMRYEMISKSIRELDKIFLDYKHGGLELNHNRYYLYPEWLERDRN